VVFGIGDIFGKSLFLNVGLGGSVEILHLI
jgi:hypothetical protein